MKRATSAAASRQSGVADRIIVVDSGSEDDTCALAEAAGAEVVRHPWTNYAQQFNWAIEQSGVTGGWTMPNSMQTRLSRPIWRTRSAT